MIDIKIKKITAMSQEEFGKLLDQFYVFNHFHTGEMINYYDKLDKKIKNLSFVCFNENIPVAIVPLAITKVKNFKKISFGNEPCHLPTINFNIKTKLKRKLFTFIYTEIFKIFQKEKVKYADFQFYPIFYKKNLDTKNKLIIDYKDSFHIIKFFNLKIVNINTNIIDLSSELDELESNLNKEFRKEFKKEFYEKIKILVINKNNYDINQIEKYFNLFKKLHIMAANRLTRPHKSWDQMLLLLKKGNTSLFVAEYDNRFISGLYCNQFHGLAAPWSQANSNKKILKKYSIRHFLEWYAIKYYHSLKYKYYEVGQTYFFDKYWRKTTAKHKDIGKLKVRFGGDFYPRHYYRIEQGNKNIFKENV